MSFALACRVNYNENNLKLGKLVFIFYFPDGRRIRIPGHRLLSNRVVRCITYVEAFTLRAADLEEVTSLFARFLRSPRVQGGIR